jgi:putative permease
MTKRRIPHRLSVWVVFLLFVACLLVTVLGLMPLLSNQATDFVREIPNMISKGRQLMMQLPERYPGIISAEQINELSSQLRNELGNMGQNIVQFSLASIPGIVTIAVYMILLPLLVFFFLMDRDEILDWFTSLLPKDKSLANKVWNEMDIQIGNYVSGKVWEIIIIGVSSYIVFSFMGLNYAPLLAVLVGLSVIVPYVGATIVTFPVAMVAFVQWGFTDTAGWLLLAYGILQALDGNVLVPLLFSEAVNLHPVAIIVAILVFGGIWGFWGVFFAIPLATLVKLLISVWPRAADVSEV